MNNDDILKKYQNIAPDEYTLLDALNDAREDERTALKATARGGGKSNDQIREEIRYCNVKIEEVKKMGNQPSLLVARRNALLWVLASQGGLAEGLRTAVRC